MAKIGSGRRLPGEGMRRVRYLRMILMTGGIVLAAPALAQTSAATANSAALPSADVQDKGVQDIVVTAQKREQNLQSVPISITALNEKTIVANRIENTRDLNAVAPNLTVREGPGGVGVASFSMRGLLTAGTAAGTDKGISVYIDGVYLQNTLGSIMDLADIERIEVLKGPQGTLFGRNATGGAISIITRNPTGKFGVRQEFTYGNYDQFRSKTRVNLPAWGPLSASITYMHNQRRGDTRNLGAGTRLDYGPATGGARGIRTSPKWLGDKNVDAVSFAAKLDVADGLDVVYKFDYSNERNTPGAQGVIGFYPQSLGPGFGDLIGAVLASQPDPSVLTPITNHRPKAVNNAFSTPGFVRGMGHNLTVKYALTDEVSFKNILSYRKDKTEATFQLDGYGGLINTSPFLGTVGAPYYLIVTNAFDKQSQWSDEAQINVNTDVVTFTAGLIHFHNHQVTGGFTAVANNIFFSALPGNVIAYTGNSQTAVSVNSDAVYAQPEIHLTNRLDLVGGVRLTRDVKRGIDNGTVGLSQPIRYRHSQPTYLIGLNYKLVDHALVYAKYSTGYISGGFLGRAYDPETARSYEIGAKADLLDRRLRVNLALFHVDYSGQQTVTTGALVGIPAAALVVVNAGDAKAKGFELETTAVPIDGLTLTGNVGYTDFHYTSVSPLFGTVDSYRPINRPKWTVQVAAEYDTSPIESLRGGHLMARVDVNFASRTFLSVTPPTPEIAALGTTPHTTIVNGRLALSDVEIRGVKAELALWVRNLLNNRQLENVSDLGFVSVGNYQRARTFGVDLSFDF